MQTTSAELVVWRSSVTSIDRIEPLLSIAMYQMLDSCVYSRAMCIYVYSFHELNTCCLLQCIKCLTHVCVCGQCMTRCICVSSVFCSCFLSSHTAFNEQFVMKSKLNVCRHWERGKGCKFGASCNFRHDHSLRTFNLCHRWMRGKCKKIDCHRLHEPAPGIPPPAFRRSRSSSLSPSMVSRSRSPSVSGFKPKEKKMPRPRKPSTNPSSSSRLPPTSSSCYEQVREDTVAELLIDILKDQGGFDAESFATESVQEKWTKISRSLHPDKFGACPALGRIMGEVMKWLNNERDKFEADHLT
jgi:hypothetical protein